MKNSIRHLASWHSDKPGELTLRNVCGSLKRSAYTISDANCMECLNKYNEHYPGPEIQNRIAYLLVNEQLKEMLDE